MCINLDDNALQLIKTPNSVSQKIRILHKTSKEFVFLVGKYRPSEKNVLVSALNTWLGLPLHGLLHQCGVAWSRSACGPAELLWKSRFLRQRPSARLHCWVTFLVFLLKMPHPFSIESRSGEFAGQSSGVIPWSLNNVLVLFGRAGRCQGLLEN